jgi:hypothetical protein
METLKDSVAKRDWLGARKAAGKMAATQVDGLGRFLVRVCVVFWLAVVSGAGVYYGLKIAVVSDALIPEGRPLIYVMNVIKESEGDAQETEAGQIHGEN